MGKINFTITWLIGHFGPWNSRLLRIRTCQLHHSAKSPRTGTGQVFRLACLSPHGSQPRRAVSGRILPGWMVKRNRPLLVGLPPFVFHFCISQSSASGEDLAQHSIMDASCPFEIRDREFLRLRKPLVAGRAISTGRRRLPYQMLIRSCGALYMPSPGLVAKAFWKPLEFSAAPLARNFSGA